MVRVRTPRRGSVRVRTRSRDGAGWVISGGIFGRRIVSGGNCLQGISQNRHYRGGAGGRPIFSEIVHQFHSRSHTYLSLASSSLRRLLVSAELKLKATRRFGDILTDVFYCVIFACVLVKF